jgi:hypothetical protein
VISGLEQIQNSGREQQIDLMEARIGVAESTMANLMAQGVYAAGTEYGGKTLTGLDAAVESTITSGQSSTYGGISRTTWAFWKNYSTGNITLPTAGSQGVTGTMLGLLNKAWASLTRGSDRADLIIMDNNYWSIYLQSLQSIQRFTSPDSAALGFPSIKFMDADVVLDGGIGGYIYTNAATGGTAFLLNTKYIRLRPHKDRNMVSLSPNRRYAVNQDAEVAILAWAGNLTCSGPQFQGRILTT